MHTYINYIQCQMCALPIIEVLEQALECAFSCFGHRTTILGIAQQNRLILDGCVVPLILIEIANVLCQ
jgi:hypothetical protein